MFVGLVPATRPAGSAIEPMALSGLPAGFVDEKIIEGLPLSTATGFSPDGRLLFVATKRGQVLVHDGTRLLATPFVTLTSEVNSSGDRGLLGLAVHPRFPMQPYVYLAYTYDPPGVAPDATDGARVSRVVRLTADAATGHATAVPGSLTVLIGGNSTAANIGDPLAGADYTKASCMQGGLTSGSPIEDCIPSDSKSHSIGALVFGPDESLYVSSGDASDFMAPDARALRAQHLDSLAGKVLRIDPLTGAGLPDNPFYDPAAPRSNRSRVWSYGLRNPFRTTVDQQNGEVFIGDVGWNTWEEIDAGKGANFGWPCYEGGAVTGAESTFTTSRVQPGYQSSARTSAACAVVYDQGLGLVRAPRFAYDHSGGGASVGAGAVVRTPAWPSAYQGSLFFFDYVRKTIRTLTERPDGTYAVSLFATSSAPLVHLFAGPDGNLYWIRYLSAGTEVRRIRSTGNGNSPPVVQLRTDPTAGRAPLTVQFDTTGTFDPDAQGLAYAWDFGNGSTSTEANPSHVFDEPGTYSVTLQVTETSAPGASSRASVDVVVGVDPPIARIAEPADGTRYRIGDDVAYSGSATVDGEPLPESTLEWDMRLRHNTHYHFFELGSGAGGLLPIEDHGDDTSIQLCLTATTPSGLRDTQCVQLVPDTATITLASTPPGLRLDDVDEGLEVATPASIQPVVASVRTVVAPAVQEHLSFVGWADGPTDRQRTFTVGSEPMTLTALYENRPPTAAIVATPVTGQAPLAVKLSPSGSADPEGDVLSYRGVTSTGETSTAATPQFTFSTVGTHEVRLTVTDALGASATASTSVTVTTGSGPPGGTKPVAVLVSGIVGQAGDKPYVTRLGALGFQVVSVDDDRFTRTSLAGASLVVISSSVVPSKIGSWLATQPVPVMSNEAYVLARLGLAAGGSDLASQTSLIVTDPSHPIAAGLTGRQLIATTTSFSVPRTPAPGAKVVATTVAKAPLLLAIDRGGALRTGLAPARRVAFPFAFGAPARANATGWRLFDAAVRWLAEPPG